MPSMKNVIQKYNSKITENPKPTKNKTCSCQQKSDCSLNHNCLSEYLVYNTVMNTSTKKITTKLSKRVPKRDITITRHHLKVNRSKKYRAF